jgi:asparagine synthetase B (glutamine-hydrolysing)
MTNVPFGVFLSGGLDSSLMVAMASRHLNNTKATNARVPNFTLSFVNLKVMIDLD